MNRVLQHTHRQLTQDKQQLLGKLDTDNLYPEDIFQLRIIDAQLKTITEYLNKQQ